MQAGWYSLGPTPGEVGPAVVLGHVDGYRNPGIFYRLHELVPGDDVEILRAALFLDQVFQQLLPN